MGEVAKVEQAPAPLLVLGTAIVPVTPSGTGLTGVDTPGARPFVPTGALGSVPSEEVMPIGGMAVPTWAKAGLQNDKGHAAAAINNGLMVSLRDEGTRLGRRFGASTAIGKPTGLMTHISFPLTEDGVSEQARWDRASRDPCIAVASIP
jgi:hypothetical protein